MGRRPGHYRRRGVHLMELNARHGWLWLSISVVLVSFAQLLLKYAMQQLPGGPGAAAYLMVLQRAYWFSVDLPIVLGLGSYVISVLCWIGTLSRLPLSMAYPSLALSYLLVYAGATWLPMFNETGSPTRLFGILAVILGVWLVSLPASATDRS